MDARYWFRKNFSGRKLIDKRETSASYVQIIGFVLIAVGILTLFFPNLSPSITKPFSFFIIMLGMSLAFPALLQGRDGEESTMRIVVFMIVNVICILLLHIGLKDDVKSLKDIGLDQYWMGVIAFAFGAKATQSFFESKMAVLTPAPSGDSTASSDLSGLPMADVNIITEAIKEKGEEWINSFPFVTGLSVRNKTTNSNQLSAVALVFKVTAKKSSLEYGKIPPYLSYVSKAGEKYRILTDVVKEDLPGANSTIIKDDPPFPIGNSISRTDGPTGSIGLVLRKSGDTSDYILGCYHVFCAPELKNKKKEFIASGEPAQLSCASADDNGTNIVGVVALGVMDDKSDFSIAKTNTGIKMDTGMKSLGKIPSSFGFVFPEDVGATVTICGRSSGVIKGKIKSHAAVQTVGYFQNTVKNFYSNLIEIEPISKGGDSGSVVINGQNEVIGLIIAGNPQSSYVLPVQDFLLDNDYSLKTT